jgi:saccharopine dehydrogenase (NAD+, L-lysine-forming)
VVLPAARRVKSEQERKVIHVHLVVLGGGGAMGRVTVRALVEDDRVEQVSVVDLETCIAERSITWLDKGREKARALSCDVRDHAALVSLLSGADAVLNATDYPFNLEVMEAALAARVSYADLGGLFHMTKRQYQLDAGYREAGICGVLGIGSTPGVTNILARIAADQLDRIERLDVRIGSGDFRPANAPFVPPYSIRTIFDECVLAPMVYRNGRWSEVAPMSGQEAIDFPPPVGRAIAMHTLHSEVALFPVSFHDKGIRQVSFKIAFPEDFLLQLKLLVGLGLADTAPVDTRGPLRGSRIQVAPRELMVTLLSRRAATMPAASDPDDCDVLRIVASGTQGGQRVTLVEDMIVLPYKPWRVGAGDLDTGVPLAIAGILLAQGSHQRPGVHGAELIFDPRDFLAELARYGMRATETTTRTL